MYLNLCFPQPISARLFTLAALCLAFTGCTAIDPKSTDFLSSYQGFKQQSGIDDAIVYQGDPKLQSAYDKIIIKEVRIVTPKEKAEGKEISPEDVARLKASFDKILRKEFGKHFEVVKQRGRNTLELRVAVVEFQPGDPLLFILGHAPYVSYASTASGLLGGSNFGSGNAIIQGELLDSRSRKRVFAMIDRKSGGKLEILEGITRWGHVEKAMRSWSRRVIRPFAATEGKPQTVQFRNGGSRSPRRGP